MNPLIRITTLSAALMLLGAAGCSKEKASETPTQAEAIAADVPGMAKETLLVMKFHHDS